MDSETLWVAAYEIPDEDHWQDGVLVKNGQGSTDEGSSNSLSRFCFASRRVQDLEPPFGSSCHAGTSVFGSGRSTTVMNTCC